MRSPAVPDAFPATPRPQAIPLVAGLAAIVAVALAAARYGDRLAALAVIGTALGFVLAHFSFGFAWAVRSLIVRREDGGAQAILAMVAVTTLLFAPLLAAGEALGRPLSGAVAPAGLQTAVGAFVFGVGMQLAGGCASGSLYAAGVGAGRALIALAAFCAGGFWASLHMEEWGRLPAPPPLALGEAVGWPAAVLLQLVLIAAIAAFLRRRVAARPIPAAALRPLLVAGVLLAALNAATLLVAGHPWSITWGFTLIAAKGAQALGWNPDAAEYWSAGFARDALEAPLLADVTTVMNAGILAGAAVAAASLGRYRAVRPGSWGLAAAAALGGLVMGYGARIAFGCNVGAFFSGTASTSLHGWLWIAAALPGSWLGIRLRPLFGLRT